MAKVDKGLKVITSRMYWTFKKTLNREQENSVFEAFFNADRYDTKGNEVVEGDYILVQESNNDGEYKDKFELIENSFPPTYKVSKEVFEKTFTDFAALTW